MPRTPHDLDTLLPLATSEAARTVQAARQVGYLDPDPSRVASLPSERIHTNLGALQDALEWTAGDLEDAAPDTPPGAYRHGLLWAAGVLLALRCTPDLTPLQVGAAYALWLASWRAETLGNADLAQRLDDFSGDPAELSAFTDAVNSLPSVQAVGAFLAGHHAFSLACEALTDADYTPETPGEGLAKAASYIRTAFSAAPIARA